MIRTVTDALVKIEGEAMRGIMWCASTKLPAEIAASAARSNRCPRKGDGRSVRDIGAEARLAWTGLSSLQGLRCLAQRRKLSIGVDSMLADFPDVGVSPIRPDTAGMTQALGGAPRPRRRPALAAQHATAGSRSSRPNFNRPEQVEPILRSIGSTPRIVSMWRRRNNSSEIQTTP